MYFFELDLKNEKISSSKSLISSFCETLVSSLPALFFISQTRLFFLPNILTILALYATYYVEKHYTVIHLYPEKWNSWSPDYLQGVRS